MTLKYDLKLYIKVAIMFIIMFVVGSLPPFGQVTEMGMKIIGVFVGIIFAWIAIDTLWPSVFGFVALSFTGYTTILGAFGTALSNSTVIMILFGATFAGVIAKTDCIQIINKWLMTRKILAKSPWNLVLALLLFQVLASICNGGMAGLFLGWEMIIQLTTSCGYKKGAPITCFLIATSVFLWVMTGNLFPFKAGTIAYLGFFEPVLGVQYEYVPFIVLSAICLIVFLALMMISARYIFRIDASQLRVSEEKMKELEAIQINSLQKTGLIAVVAFIILMLLPSFMPKTWAITIILNKLGLVGIVVILLVYFSLLRDENGKQIIDIGQCHSYVPWSVLWLLAFAMPLGDAMKSADSGIMATIIDFATPLFSGMGVTTFMLVAMIFIGVATQVCNNMVLGAMFIPVFTNICVQMGGNPYVLFLMIMIPLNCAYLTPAGSLQGAMVHGNPSMDKKWAYSLSLIALIATFISCALLLPLGNLFW